MFYPKLPDVNMLAEQIVTMAKIENSNHAKSVSPQVMQSLMLGSVAQWLYNQDEQFMEIAAKTACSAIAIIKAQYV